MNRRQMIRKLGLLASGMGVAGGMLELELPWFVFVGPSGMVDGMSMVTHDFNALAGLAMALVVCGCVAVAVGAWKNEQRALNAVLWIGAGLLLVPTVVAAARFVDDLRIFTAGASSLMSSSIASEASVVGLWVLALVLALVAAVLAARAPLLLSPYTAWPGNASKG